MCCCCCCRMICHVLLQDDVGRIIGKSGNTIRDIKAQSGAEIKVHSDLATVKFKGTPESIELAKHAIRKIIGGDGMVILREIDEQSMGYLAKRGFLKDVQDQLGVQVEMDRRTLRILSTTGDTSLAEEARERIKERIEHRNVIETTRIPVPAHCYKNIHQDELLRTLQEAQGIAIEFRKDDEGMEVELKGPRGVVEEAAECVHTIVTGGTSRGYVNILPDLLVSCKPSKLCDLNADINRYVQGRGNITVELKPQESRAIIAGSPEVLPQAKEELEKMLEYYFAGQCMSIRVPRDAVESICADNNGLLGRMQSRQLMANLDREACNLWLCGTHKGVETAQLMLNRELESCNGYPHNGCT
eukprot:GHVS01019284.1.p1 GENE.GHVS01019284.1~~GHVS01019284.1.p1  ORF type:complete len:358 (+),score=39.58 GHVS01019284.1:63-1136(+)